MQPGYYLGPPDANVPPSVLDARSWMKNQTD